MFIEVDGKNIDCFSGREVILFGAGSYGRHALEEFEKINAHIIGFCDNNKKLMGAKIQSYPVFSAEELRNYPGAEIIITSTFEDEIREQLKHIGGDRLHSAKVGVLHKNIPFSRFRNTTWSGEESNRFLRESLDAGKSFFAGRLGSVELECMVHYLYFLGREKHGKTGYPHNVSSMMNINAGFFPPEDVRLDEFCRLYLEDLNCLDMIWTMWSSKYEDMLYHDYYPEKPVAEYDESSFPVGYGEPWTKALEGKKVLVLHPFEESIQNNYKIREKLFAEPDFLPEFELKTLKTVQSIAGSRTEYKDWFAALQDMKDRMQEIEFDVALVGAGAYGLPLAAFAKKIGKTGIHLGGILQLLFGIKGKAWDKRGLYNEYWTSPLESERPAGYQAVEAGRYW